MKRSPIGRGLLMLGIMLMLINQILLAEMNYWVLSASIACMLIGIIIVLAPVIRGRWKKRWKHYPRSQNP